ncbi:SOUL family heme-binding protein [Cognatiluteimonas profundi]|uniref:SOUL family heme-binding protein n=1 Tax=Cognatiluteimonas profundi TaxID=2594501 RepID=UPI00131CF858|nr:heme-binding protein [Lysobacter profundi]
MNTRTRRLCGCLLLSSVLIAGATMAAEEPAFRRVSQDGAFSVRDYPALVVAEVTVPGDQDAAVRAGFRLLAGYIFGGNVPKQRIPMTAPVTQAPASPGERIAMTAPVTQAEGAGAWTVRFTMPAGYSLQTLPRPDDARVRLQALPPTRMAVVRFSGRARATDVERRTALLRQYMATHGLNAAGPPTLARYNPPWTPWFIRRNEVMIPLQP